VVLASGSGPQDRNCEILGHKPFLVIADHLAKNGIATLRFDDRGTGKSSGNFQEATLEDFASDVLACVAYIQKDPSLKDRVKIGLAGHSEGGMHVLMAAKKNKKIEFVIELASVGTSGKDVLIEQQYLIPLKNGGSQEHADWNKKLYTGMTRIVLKYNQEKAQDPLTNFLDSMYQIAPKEVKEQSNIFNFKIGMNMFMNTTWMRQFLAFETADYLKKLKIPVLVINGSEDIQVPGLEAQEGFEKHLSPKSKIVSNLALLGGLNHLFQTCTTCSIYEYGELEETISITVLNMMTEWIKGLR
jgi:alpha/beta superfamily hydrolase